MSVTSGDRGQTLHDFAIGMTIFLLVLGYVFAFVPSLFEPFTSEDDSTAIRVDRTADTLTRDVLVENDSVPGVLNETCTEKFFDYKAPNYCRFESPEISKITGLPSGTNVNITMKRNGTIRSHNGTPLKRGPSVEGAGGRVIRAVRIVMFDGMDHQFVVKMW